MRRYGQRHEIQTHQGGKACSALVQDNHGAEALLGSPTLHQHIVYLPAKNNLGPVRKKKCNYKFITAQDAFPH